MGASVFVVVCDSAGAAHVVDIAPATASTAGRREFMLGMILFLL
jgi:hypothetical protein